MKNSAAVTKVFRSLKPGDAGVSAEADRRAADAFGRWPILASASLDRSVAAPSIESGQKVRRMIGADAPSLAESRASEAGRRRPIGAGATDPKLKLATALGQLRGASTNTVDSELSQRNSWDSQARRPSVAPSPSVARGISKVSRRRATNDVVGLVDAESNGGESDAQAVVADSGYSHSKPGRTADLNDFEFGNAQSLGTINADITSRISGTSSVVTTAFVQSGSVPVLSKKGAQVRPTSPLSTVLKRLADKPQVVPGQHLASAMPVRVASVAQPGVKRPGFLSRIERR